MKKKKEKEMKKTFSQQRIYGMCKNDNFGAFFHPHHLLFISLLEDLEF